MQNWSGNKSSTQCRQKRILIISSEGEITEPQYFTRLNSMSSTAVFDIVESFCHESSPLAVLKRMKNYLKDHRLGTQDEAWIVIDQDRWPQKYIQKIKEWTDTNPKYHMAVSQRRFEDWLKLHIPPTDKELQKKYQPLLQGKIKRIPEDFITKKRVLDAVEKARKIYNTPESAGNVFQLVQSFLKK